MSVQLSDAHDRLAQFVIASHLGTLESSKLGEKYNYDRLKAWMLRLGFSRDKADAGFAKARDEAAAKAAAEPTEENKAAAKAAYDAWFNEAMNSLETKSFASEASTKRNNILAKECFAIVDGKKQMTDIGQELLKGVNGFFERNEAMLGKKLSIATLAIPEAEVTRKGRSGQSSVLGGGSKAAPKVLGVGSIGFHNLI